MPSQQSTDAAKHLNAVNARLDTVEQQLDQLEDLLEDLWYTATEPTTAAEN